MSIFQLKKEHRLVLETKETAYVIDIHKHGHLQHVYWGKKFPEKADYEALQSLVFSHSSFEATRGVMGYDYIPWGEMVYTEPTLKASSATGERGFKWEYAGLDIDTEDSGKQQVVIKLRESLGRYQVEVTYDVFRQEDMIARSQTITNINGEALYIEAARSMQVSLPPAAWYNLSHLAGKWVGEFQLIQEEIREGRKTIDSRRGNTSHHANPWFAIDQGAGEDSGNVWFGHLAYSGNWDLHVEKDAHGFIHVCGGINDFDFMKVLQPGELFQTPVFYLGYTSKGFTGMSHQAHRFQRKNILPGPHREAERKVLYNSWEATYFDVSEENQKALADEAAAIGCELFVVDDGWFGKRNSDDSSLGDWEVNHDKFPNGLDPLISYVKEKGMDFGIWLEPEMVNKDSRLFQDHPEWVYHFVTQDQTTARNQLVLQFGREDVRTYVKKMLDQLLGSSDISFVKWDMNRSLSEVGRMGAGVEEQKQLWHEHVEGLYEVLDYIKKAYPHVLVETCSGGGGRIDLGVLQRTDQFWTSDNTDARDRLSIQRGCSYAYHQKAMMCWVTDAPNWLNQRTVPLKYWFHSAMMGGLGIGGNLHEWTKEEKEEAARWITFYKHIRPVIQEGLAYRLTASHPKKETEIMQYVSEDGSRSIVFLLENGLSFGPHPVQVKVKGLDENARYYSSDGTTATGAFWMNHGVIWPLEEEYQCEIIEFSKVED
ncbi:alpha-galactosidase [Salibacterium sp. K-3]